jgi:hypothetical protein
MIGRWQLPYPFVWHDACKYGRRKCVEEACNKEGCDVSKKEIKSCVPTVREGFGEEVNLQSVAFFHCLPTLEAKVGYIDHLLNLVVKYPTHLARVFQIVVMINLSLEV